MKLEVNISRSKLIYGAIFVALIISAYGFGNKAGYNIGYKEGEAYVFAILTSRNSIMAEDINPQFNVEVKQFRNGIQVYDYVTHNIVVNIGKRYIRNLLGWNNLTTPINATKYISLGQDASVVETDTKLATEKTANGLVRATGTVTCLNTTAYQVQYTWTATGTDTVTSTGLNWSPTSNSNNNLFAEVVIATVNVIANDQIQVTWQISAP